jgi:hypothetical protein
VGNRSKRNAIACGYPKPTEVGLIHCVHCNVLQANFDKILRFDPAVSQRVISSHAEPQASAEQAHGLVRCLEVPLLRDCGRMTGKSEVTQTAEPAVFARMPCGNKTRLRPRRWDGAPRRECAALDICDILPWRHTRLSSKPVREVIGVLVPQLCCDRTNGSSRSFGKQRAGAIESNFRPVFKIVLP